MLSATSLLRSSESPVQHLLDRIAVVADMHRLDPPLAHL